MTQEPATNQFTAAQLAEFLEQLEVEPGPDAPRSERGSGPIAVQNAEPATRWQRPERALFARPSPERAKAGMSLARAIEPEPPTMLGVGHVIPIGTPRWRGPARGRAGATPDRPLPEPRASALRLPGEELRFRAPETFASAALEQEHSRLARGFSLRLHTRRWRVAFVLSALSSAGLLVALSLRGPRDGRDAQVAPPPLPARGAAARSSPAPTPAPDTPEVAALPVQSSAPTALQPVEPADADMQTASVVLNARARAVLRREAVDALLSGRTREALDAYRALLSASPASAETPAIEQLVRLLAREQARCAAHAGASCES